RRGPGGDHAPRPLDRLPARSGGDARGRRRAAPRFAHQPRRSYARDRGHLLRRGGPRAAGLRRRAPRLLEPFRRDRVGAEVRGAPRLAAAAGDARPWAAHVVAVAGEGPGGVQYETDRLRFLGRGRGVRTPLSVVDGRPLSNTVGAVLDPIFSLRRRVRLAPGATARLTFTTLVAGSRDAAVDLADKYRDPAAFERAATMAWAQAQVQLRHHGIHPDEANLFQRLANRLLYSDPSLRAPAEVLLANAHGAPALWAQGISGDLPILLVRIDEMDDVGLVRQLLRAHEYFRTKLLAVDLVILNEKAASYHQDLQDALEALVRSQFRPHDEGPEPRGAVFVLRRDLVAAETLSALQTAARVVLVAHNG